MKIIRSKRNFVVGIFWILLLLARLITSIYYNSFDLNDILFMVYFACGGIMLFNQSVSPCFLGEKTINNPEDERDVYISLKSTSIASRIMCYCITIASLVFFIIFQVSENPVFAIVSISLIACLLLFSVVCLLANIFYEKKG